MLHKILPILILGIGSLSTSAQKSVVDYVNPFIGTTNFGTCNPGAVRPNGLMSVTPFNVMGSDENVFDKDKRWWSTPYLFENVFLTGFAHTNLSGVGCPELGALLTMPTTGERKVDYHEYGSHYSDEKATPGYYSVMLTDYGIRAELTATPRTSLERYTFPAGNSHILLNLGEGLTNETGASVRRVSDCEFEGTKLLGTFCYAPQAVFPIYFVLRVNKQPKASGFWKKQRPMEAEAAWDPDQGKYKLYTRYGRDLSGDDIGVWLDFDTQQDEQVEVSMGVSFVSIANARENLEREQNGRGFDEICREARNDWEEHLSRIAVEGGTDDQKTVFYTALYHMLIHPNILQDVNGQHPTMESDRIGVSAPGTTRYTVFSLWDTYRNVSQLLSLVYPEKQEQMLRSMIQMYDESGWLPKWELYGRESYTMDGDPATAYIADACLSSARFEVDWEKAFRGLWKSATDSSADNRIRPYLNDFLQLGYVPMRDKNDFSVSNCLENCVNDYALGRMAHKLGHETEAQTLQQRSLAYRRYYDKSVGSLCPVWPDGSFLRPFNPRAGENFSAASGFHEGSAWNYTFAVPHDAEGLARIMGGKKNYIDRLEWIFTSGLYDPANVPDIIFPFLFSRFKGEEHRTQKWARWALDNYFKNTPDGIPGNDDTGTMSAWAVFTMMGLYPDCPGSQTFTLTAPVFKKITIRLDPKYYDNDQIVILSDGDARLTRTKKYSITEPELVRTRVLRLY